MNFLETKVYVLHKKTAQQTLNMAISSEEGRLFNCMICIAFSAFMFEAYINYIGKEQWINYTDRNKKKKFAKWSEWDNDQRPTLKDKLKKLPVNFTELENNKIKELIALRNLIVHGRTEIVSKNLQQLPKDVEQGIEALESNLVKKCTLKNATNLFNCMKSLIEKINESSEEKKSKVELWSSKNGSFQVAP